MSLMYVETDVLSDCVVPVDLDRFSDASGVPTVDLMSVKVL